MLAILAAIGPLLPFALQLIGAIVMKNQEAVDAQKAFLNFTNEMAKAGLISVGLHDSFNQQVQTNAQKAAAKYAAEQAAKSQLPK